MKTNIIPPGFKTKLDEFQLPAATSGLGPKLCGASPGSGKTTLYAHRAGFLLANGVKPENIMATTFTKKAAEEMKSRIKKVASDNHIEANLDEMWIGTFHSLGIRACRIYSSVIGYDDNFTIDDDDQQEIQIKKILKDNPHLNDNKQLRPKDILSAISYARNAGEDYLSVFQKKLTQVSNHIALVDIAEAYELSKRKRNVFDFDDMLIYWLDILNKSSSARNFFQNKFHYLLVDEYQDTNYIQNEILDIIAAKHRNIFVCGDCRQSIFAFRAAKVENMQYFSRRYPDTENFYLCNNYRSTPELVSLANASISNNPEHDENAISKNNSGSMPELILPIDENRQCEIIVQAIKNAHKKGTPYKEMAVLYRNNNMSILLEQRLNENLIPYVKKGAQFWKQAHIRLALAWMNLMQNPADTSSMIRCLEMCQGIGQKAITEIMEAINGPEDFQDFLEDILVIDLKNPIKYDEFKNHILKMELILSENEDPLTDMIRYLVEFITPYTEKKWKDDGPERAQDFDVLINMSSQFTDLRSLLEAIMLQDERKKQKDRDEVTLSTAHSAKGLEWDIVFCLGLINEIFPSKYVQTPQELQEERRLFYVMITRARRRLFLFCSQQIVTYGKFLRTKLSIFLEELLDLDVLKIREL